MSNGNVISSIDTLLATDDPISEKQALRPVLAAMSDFLKRDEEDHLKVVQMYPVYKAILWVAGVLGISIISLIILFTTGQATIVMAAK